MEAIGPETVLSTICLDEVPCEVFPVSKGESELFLLQTR